MSSALLFLSRISFADRMRLIFTIGLSRITKAQTEKYADRMEWAHNGKELAQAKNRLPAFSTIEGGCALAGDISRVKLLKEQGVAMMTLTWNRPNELGCGTSKNEGLTDFGKAAIKEMEKVGMLVDLSHISDAGFDDACSVATKPLIASHSIPVQFAVISAM